MSTENEVAASDRAHLMELFIALRRLPPRMGYFWGVAYGRANLAVLGEDSSRSTWIEERALRVMLALAMIVPEPMLRKRFEVVVSTDGSLADVLLLVRPLAEARKGEQQRVDGRPSLPPTPPAPAIDGTARRSKQAQEKVRTKSSRSARPSSKRRRPAMAKAATTNRKANRSKRAQGKTRAKSARPARPSAKRRSTAGRR